MDGFPLQGLQSNPDTYWKLHVVRVLLVCVRISSALGFPGAAELRKDSVIRASVSE